MKVKIRYVGLDVHKDSIAVAVADSGNAPAELLRTLANDFGALAKCLDRLGPPNRLSVCYEAGPTGYDLARRLLEAGIRCTVVAPSLVPRDGRRIKTDRRDARKLAHFLRSGDLTAVTVPDRTTEAMRDLTRARDDAKRAERVVRHQLDKFLLRHGRIWSGKTKWTGAHLAWVRQQSFAEPAAQRVVADGLGAVEQASDRVACLTKDLTELVADWSMRPLVTAFQALRGVQVVSAAILAAEIGDFRRFENPRQLMAYLGLVPSEHSSGGSRRQGRITRTGNTHARRILVEAAWNYRHRARLTRAIAARQEAASPAVRRIAWKAQQRLHRRYVRLLSRGKNKQQTVTAVARELAGFVWAIAQQNELLASSEASRG
jgi:transposase